MSEHTGITLNQSGELSIDAVGQNTSQDAPENPERAPEEREQTLEKSDVDALQRRAGELQGIGEVQRGLELSILGAGLQVMADRYGADTLLAALQSPGVISFQDVIAKLAQEKGEREALYGAIQTEPIDALAKRFNEELGGAADMSYNTDSGIARIRNFEVSQIQGNMASGNSLIPRYNNRKGVTESASLLLSGDFDNLLKNHPQLVEKFRESNDTLALLKGIREIHETEYIQFSSDLEQAKTKVEEKIAQGEAGVAELQTLADDIYGDEIASLEERHAAASSDAAREMIQGMLDKRAAEVAAVREEFESKIKAVRDTIVVELGADRLNGLRPYAPEQTRPIDHDEYSLAA